LERRGQNVQKGLGGGSGRGPCIPVRKTEEKAGDRGRKALLEKAPKQAGTGKVAWEKTN